MELMSMLLLCAFVASLPQSLGVSGVMNTEMKLNSSIMIENSVSARNRHRQVSSSNDHTMIISNILQAVHDDRHCKHCVSCMERILKAQNSRTKYILSNRHPEELYNDKQHEQFQANRNERSIRSKRNSTDKDMNKDNTETESMVVTKYTNEDGKIYALKVNEINKKVEEQNDVKSTCKVYSVKKSFSCGSGESELILAKKKINKKDKKPKDKNRTTMKPKLTTGAFKKREVRIENSHVRESFMPSIEELY